MELAGELKTLKLRGWSLKNFASIAYQWARASIFNRRTTQEISAIEEMQSSLIGRLAGQDHLIYDQF